MGQKAVLEKSNEIKVIPLILENIQIKGDVITIDAMGTQTTTAEKIKSKHATVQTQPTAPTERLITSATLLYAAVTDVYTGIAPCTISKCQ